MPEHWGALPIMPKCDGGVLVGNVTDTAVRRRTRKSAPARHTDWIKRVPVRLPARGSAPPSCVQAEQIAVEVQRPLTDSDIRKAVGMDAEEMLGISSGPSFSEGPWLRYPCADGGVYFLFYIRVLDSQKDWPDRPALSLVVKLREADADINEAICVLPNALKGKDLRGILGRAVRELRALKADVQWVTERGFLEGYTTPLRKDEYRRSCH